MKKTNKTQTENANRVNNLRAAFEAMQLGMKETKKERNLWKAQFCSLSRLLRVAQTSEGWKVAESVFEKYNLPTTRKVKPSDVLATIPAANFVADKKGNKFPAYVSRRVVTEEKDGNQIPVTDKDGNQIYTYNLVAIRDGAWTFDKFVKMLASR